MEAAFHGRDDIVKQLIENNAQLNTQSGTAYQNSWNLYQISNFDGSMRENGGILC